MSDERPYEKKPAAPARQEPPVFPTLKEPPPLSDRERKRIRETVDIVKTEMPDMVPIIKSLVDGGLIHGWRNVFIQKDKNGTS